LEINIKEIDLNIPFETIEHLMTAISKERCARIAAFANNGQKVLSLYTELFLRENVSKILCVPQNEIEILVTPNGKPYINRPDFHFSLSHSANAIAFACDRVPVGIDIEHKSRNALAIANRFFTEEESQNVAQSNDPDHEFLKYWTRKEAYIKMTGEGLKCPLDSFVAENDEKTPVIYKTFQYTGPITGIDYTYSICTQKA